MKRWYAFDIGPNGGISTNAVSPPLNSMAEAKEWAATRFSASKVSQIGIAEMVCIAERESPPVVFKTLTGAPHHEVVHHEGDQFGGFKKSA